MFCLSGKGPVISCDVFPAFDASDGTYEIGLVDLSTYNSIPNIEKGVNDKFYYDGKSVVTIDEGSYEIGDIEKFITENIEPGVGFSLTANNNTLKAYISCSKEINFNKPGSIASILGFDNVKLDAGKTHISNNPVDIIKVNTIKVDCNIVRGSFDNGREGHVIHEFYPSVPPGYKLVEIPRTVIYLPVNNQSINNITVSLKDQDGNIISLRDEKVTLRLHLRKANGFSI